MATETLTRSACMFLLVLVSFHARNGRAAKSNPINRLDPSGLYSKETIYKQIPESDFDNMCTTVLNGCSRNRWGFHALLLDAQDFDKIQIGYVNLDPIYPEVTYSGWHTVWSNGCENIMIDWMPLEYFYSKMVKKQNQIWIWWRDTSVSYYQLKDPKLASTYASTYIDSFSKNSIGDYEYDQTDLPSFRGLGVALWFLEGDILYNADGVAYGSLSFGYGGSLGASYIEGYTLSDDLSGVCGTIGGQFGGGIYISPICSDFNLNLSPMTTYYAGIQAGFSVPSVSWTFPLPAPWWVADPWWAVSDPRRGWRQFSEDGLKGNTKFNTQPIYGPR